MGKKISSVSRGLIVTGVIAVVMLTLRSWVMTPAKVVEATGHNSAADRSSRKGSFHRGSRPLQTPVAPTEVVATNLPEDEATVSLRSAQELLDRGDVAAAASLLETLIQKYPENVDILMELAMIQVLDFKDETKAKDLLELVVNLDPDHRAALSELLVIFANPAHSAQIASFLREQIAKVPGSSELNYAYGQMQAAAGKPVEAISYLERSESLTDIRGQVYGDIADTAAKLGQFEKALDAYQKAETEEEREIERLREGNKEGLDYAEDRLFALRMEHARTLIKAGRTEDADALLASITGHEDNPGFLALKNQTRRLVSPQ